MLTLRSPAKVNLFLHVVGRRSDGYHNLVSLFQSVNIFDEISFKISNKDTFNCDDSSIPNDRSNLILKAVDLFRKKTNLKTCFNINLQKIIPAQSGLGGGSGNAATTLWALNKLSDSPATVIELQNWSAEIGSDIPFFFSNGTALCEGRGEVVKNLPNLTSKKGWIVRPKNIGLSTPAVFRNVNLDTIHNRDITTLLNSSEYFNDLEEAAFQVEPILKAIKQSLIDLGFDTVIMTGSGSAFLCLGDYKLANGDYFAFPLEFVNRNIDSWY